MNGMISQVHERAGPADRPPVLFVPGALTGAWIWQRTFMPAFFAAGFDVHAMSFRAHGRRGLAINRLGLDSYVEDLAEAVAALARPPVIVAHSLGGLVTLRLLTRCDLPAAMLLSPIPPDGVLRSVVSLGLKSPLSVAKLLGVAIEPRLSALASPPLGIYSDTADPELRTAITDRLQAESLRVLAQALVARRIDVGRIATPLHLFGAQGDHVIPAREVRRAARMLDAPVTIFAGMSHTFQAERAWQTVIDEMLRWLGRQL